jgi:hypothetical protein
MALPGKRIQDQLDGIKKNVKRSYDYFKPNYDRYNEFRKFVFETSINDDDAALLASMGRPQIEVNVLEAYISRLLGEFSKQEPDIEVKGIEDGSSDPQTIQFVESHMRYVLADHDNHHTRYEVMKDLFSGGFSVLKVYTDYETPMSMKQAILIDRAFDPTMCGFDQLARYSHKGDGEFCFELFPMSKEEFEGDHPDIDLHGMTFTRSFQGFNWSYINDSTEMLILCDFYKKKKRKIDIVQVRDGRVMKKDEYDHMIATWNDPGTVPPSIIGGRRTTIETIVRYRVIENCVIEYEETDYPMLPLIFVDGNSVLIKGQKNGNISQCCRPYVYHAKGAQKLKNFAAISLANAIENEVQHKFMVAKEALPKEQEFLEAYTDVQKQSVLVYNSIHENNPAMPILNPITPVPKVPAPPEIAQALQMTDSIIQMELGSYDASLGINDNQLSGVAVVESATQSNAAAMPYIVGFMQGLQRAAQLYVELIPKYWVTPRTIPIRDKEGRRESVPINQNNKPTFNYKPNTLNVNVKAGASFQIQKARTINMVKEMMGMSQLFAQFISEKGLNFVLDNMDGRGIDQLKAMVDEWQQEMQQQKAQAMQMQQAEMQQNMQNPAAMRMQELQQKLQFEGQKAQMQHQVDLLNIQTENKKIAADLHMSEQKNRMDISRAAIDHHVKIKTKHMDGQHKAMQAFANRTRQSGNKHTSR